MFAIDTSFASVLRGTSALFNSTGLLGTFGAVRGDETDVRIVSAYFYALFSGLY